MVAVFRLPASVQADNEDQGSLALTDLDGARVDPLGMGVLNDGTPFLTQRGLAVLCGVENAHIGTISSQWREAVPKPRINKIRDILARNGHQLSDAHVQVKVGGRTIYAYREEISLAVIEYYAFDAGQFCQEEAKDNFRVLARKGFRDAIYETVGYKPARDIDDKWRTFHDRLSLVYHSAPDGYFSIFKESAEVTVALGQNGIYSDASIIPTLASVNVGAVIGTTMVCKRGSDRGLSTSTIIRDTFHKPFQIRKRHGVIPKLHSENSSAGYGKII